MCSAATLRTVGRALSNSLPERLSEVSQCSSLPLSLTLKRPYAADDWVMASSQMNFGLRSSLNSLSHNSADPSSSMTLQRDKRKGPWVDQGNLTMTHYFHRLFLCSLATWWFILCDFKSVDLLAFTLLASKSSIEQKTL